MATKFKVLPSFTKLKDFCEYRNLEISKNKFKVCILFEKIKVGKHQMSITRDMKRTMIQSLSKENAKKVMKNAFYFTKKAPFVLRYSDFCPAFAEFI